MLMAEVVWISGSSLKMKLRYVKTLEQVRQLQNLYAEPAFESFRSLSVSFETDPEVIKAVLPPPLEPDEQPLASASNSRIGTSNTLQPFGAAGLSVRCRYKNIVGDYPLTMPMSTDAAVIFGRELYGEPKKVAEINVFEDDDTFLGTVQRYGVTYMEIRGESSEVLKGGDSGISNRFYFKYMPAPDGVGFDNDPVLVRVRHTGSTRRVERLEGDLILRESEHDPVVDVPILDIKTVMYSEGDTYTHGEILDRVPGESFLPYMFGKVDDLELLAREGVVESE